ncbi:MerR family transcriptional regulator [soil metagenome]
MTLTDDSMSIAQVAEATGLSTHALRYYERAGLMLEPVNRASSTHRRYSAADVNWVTFLTKLRSTGMPIATVKEYTDLVRKGEHSTADRLELLLRHRIAVLAQLAEITRSLEAIDNKIALYKERATHA